MLSEEALILAAAFGACGLLVLGVLELLWPARPRRGRRERPPTAVPWAAAAVPPRPEPLALVESAVTVGLAPVAGPSPMMAHAGRPHRTSALARHKLDRGRSPYARRGSAPSASGEAAAARGAESVVERCLALHQAQRDPEAIVLGMAALQGLDGTVRPDEPHTTAALWSVIALARQALGEDTEARAALESAIAAAAPADRPTYQRQLATLADGVAGGLLAEAEADRRAGPASEKRLAAIQSAVRWLQCGAAAMPADTRLADLAASTEAMLWPAYERTVMAFIQRQDFRVARRLLREALADPRFPAARVESFRELFSGTFSGEIGQLTAQAIRSVQDAREVDALAALQRAESLMGALSDEALSPKRREEVDRRLWWGYGKLGERRVASGEYEAALEPLFHAFGYDVGPERHQETRALLVRALAGVADARALDIRERADAGDHEAAIVHCDRLWALLRSATEQGLTVDDVAAASVKVQRLFESLGRARPTR